jgi:predicted dehydrogenase
MSRISVGVVGCGYWGPNLIRNFSTCPYTDLVAVCDSDRSRLEKVCSNYRDIQMVESVYELLQLGLDAVAIATPVNTHYPIAAKCLAAGLHVLVEKPLAESVEQAEELVSLAAIHERVLMVDHTYLFGSPIRRIKQLIENDELGELYYVDGVRINLGLFQRDVNVIWDLAPHDLAIMDYILGIEARSISAWGCSHANPSIEDIAYLNVDFDDRLMANFHVNWLSPVKMRQMIFAGKRKSLVFNELNPTEPLKVYDRGIEIGSERDTQRQLQIGYRSGDVWSPHVESNEALQTMVTHFADCILNGTPCESGGEFGLRIVRYLESATRSIRAQGGRIVLRRVAGRNIPSEPAAQTRRFPPLVTSLPPSSI